MPSPSTGFNCAITTEVGPAPAGLVTTQVLVPPGTSAACPPALTPLPTGPQLFCIAALTLPPPLVRKVKERVIVEKRVDCVSSQPE